MLKDVLYNGTSSDDRTGVGTIRQFGLHYKISVEEVFPLLTTKKVFYRSLIHELIWILMGTSSISYLKEHKVHIWDAWADDFDCVNGVYGVQLRNWQTANESLKIDQLVKVVDSIKNNPASRRHIFSYWNVGEVDQMGLPPCPTLGQFFVNNGYLSLQMYQRSADLFLGFPFDLAEYALLLRLVAKECNLKAKELMFCIGDAHIYKNHIPQVELQLSRDIANACPRLDISKANLFDLKIEDIEIYNYFPHDPIPAPVAV